MKLSWMGNTNCYLMRPSCDVCSNNLQEYSDASTNSSEEIGGQTCHQCRRNERDGVVWCLRCDRRGYCSNCISKWLVYFSNRYYSLGLPFSWGGVCYPRHHFEGLCWYPIGTWIYHWRKFKKFVLRVEVFVTAERVYVVVIW